MTILSSHQLETLLQQQPEVIVAKVEGDGKHYTVTIVSDVFVDQPKVKRQLWVYTILNPHIISGALHAIQLNTWTQGEWQQICAEHGSRE